MKIDDAEVVIRGNIIKIIQLKDEWDYDIDNPEEFIKKINSQGIKADIFSFIQRIPDTTPKYDYLMEWDNFAAIPINSFDQWWMKQIDDKVRNRARRAEKKGVEIKEVDLDEALVDGIIGIYNENPVRQGRPYDHYGEAKDVVKADMEDRVDRSSFVCAFYKGELIGFIKLINAGNFIRTSGTVAKMAHRDKSPMNALIAASVKACADRNMPYLVYGKYAYGGKGVDSLTEFKEQNGFKKVEIPRYYVPLTLTGKVGLKLNMHNGVKQALPEGLVKRLIDLRKKWYARNGK